MVKRMSSWTALNVEYLNTSYRLPDLEKSRINYYRGPEYGDFDLVLDVFDASETEYVRERLRDVALWKGHPRVMVLVEGNDTSDVFTFKQITNEGDVIETWTNHETRGEYDIEHDFQAPLEKIYDKIGLRPSYGGNYRQKSWEWWSSE